MYISEIQWTWKTFGDNLKRKGRKSISKGFLSRNSPVHKWRKFQLAALCVMLNINYEVFSNIKVNLSSATFVFLPSAKAGNLHVFLGSSSTKCMSNFQFHRTFRGVSLIIQGLYECDNCHYNSQWQCLLILKVHFQMLKRLYKN